jgi:hypothetical protein
LSFLAEYAEINVLPSVRALTLKSSTGSSNIMTPVLSETFITVPIMVMPDSAPSGAPFVIEGIGKLLFDLAQMARLIRTIIRAEYLRNISFLPQLD